MAVPARRRRANRARKKRSQAPIPSSVPRRRNRDRVPAENIPPGSRTASSGASRGTRHHRRTRPNRRDSPARVLANSVVNRDMRRRQRRVSPVRILANSAVNRDMRPRHRTRRNRKRSPALTPAGKPSPAKLLIRNTVPSRRTRKADSKANSTRLNRRDRNHSNAPRRNNRSRSLSNTPHHHNRSLSSMPRRRRDRHPRHTRRVRRHKRLIRPGRDRNSRIRAGSRKERIRATKRATRTSTDLCR